MSSISPLNLTTYYGTWTSPLFEKLSEMHICTTLKLKSFNPSFYQDSTGNFVGLASKLQF